MKWIEISINTSNEAKEAVSNMLMEMGAGGVAIDDPFEIMEAVKNADSGDYFEKDLLENSHDNVIIKTYFPENANTNELKTTIKAKLDNISRFLNIGEGTIGLVSVEQEDWANNWKKYYKPFEICEKVIIKPTWEQYNGDGKIVIEMDPGMAFGTGTHETTQLCAKLINISAVKGITVADIGCGSGILSIIAAKLEALKVDAVDIDELAVDVSKENCKINHVEGVVDVYRGTIHNLPLPKYNVIIANIIADIIIEIGSKVSTMLASEGSFIASGIIRDRKDEVINSYKGFGLVPDKVLEDGEWVAIRFKWQDSL